MRHIKPKKTFFLGDRSYTRDDGPIPVEEHHAAILVKQGLADFVTPLAIDSSEIMAALNPAPAKAQRATAKK
jgi:hypothetical protein